MLDFALVVWSSLALISGLWIMYVLLLVSCMSFIEPTLLNQWFTKRSTVNSSLKPAHFSDHLKTPCTIQVIGGGLIAVLRRGRIYKRLIDLSCGQTDGGIHLRIGGISRILHAKFFIFL